MFHFKKTRGISSKPAVIIGLIISIQGFAENSPMQPSPAQRKEMGERHRKIAEVHIKMATCLESDREITECQKEMRESCSSTLNGNCPMMGGGMGKNSKMGRGMMNGYGLDGMMPNSGKSSTPPTTRPTK